MRNDIELVEFGYEKLIRLISSKLGGKQHCFGKMRVARKRTYVIVDCSSGWFGKGRDEDWNVCEITVLVMVIIEMANKSNRFNSSLPLPCFPPFVLSFSLLFGYEGSIFPCLLGVLTPQTHPFSSRQETPILLMRLN